jgi:hypothetical protein
VGEVQQDRTRRRPCGPSRAGTSPQSRDRPRRRQPSRRCRTGTKTPTSSGHSAGRASLGADGSACVRTGPLPASSPSGRTFKLAARGWTSASARATVPGDASRSSSPSPRRPRAFHSAASRSAARAEIPGAPVHHAGRTEIPPGSRRSGRTTGIGTPLDAHVATAGRDRSTFSRKCSSPKPRARVTGSSGYDVSTASGYVPATATDPTPSRPSDAATSPSRPTRRGSATSPRERRVRRAAVTRTGAERRRHRGARQAPG